MEFGQLSYRSQVLLLRKVAESAIAAYPFRVAKIDFIHHGENATFKIIAKNGKKFLLRLHRPDYHSTSAIKEELAWLSRLSSTTDLIVPRPVRSSSGKLIESATHPARDIRRRCCLFQWIDGRFLDKSISAEHLRKLGHVIGTLHKANAMTIKHRRYWQSDGLVGLNPKFGSIDQLNEVNRRDQSVITSARKSVNQQLKQIEKKYADKQGLIHADAHFGNILQTDRQIALIDFDDCGIGFFVYDLVIPILSIRNAPHLKNNKKKQLEFTDCLIAAYSARMSWDKTDDRLFQLLSLARRLIVLGWLNSRSDNPRLKARLSHLAAEVALDLRKNQSCW